MTRGFVLLCLASFSSLVFYGIFSSTSSSTRKGIVCPSVSPSIAPESKCASAGSLAGPNKPKKSNEAFVCFVDPGYQHLLPSFLKSHNLFSSRPILVFGVNVEPNVDGFPKAISRSLLPAHHSIYFNKIKIVLEALSLFDSVAYIEPDSVMNYRIDDVWEILEHANVSHPLLIRHSNFVNEGHEGFMQLLGVKKRSMLYVHGHIMATRSSVPFLLDAFQSSQTGLFQGWTWDEGLLNVWLWKVNATVSSCYIDMYGGFDWQNNLYFDQAAHFDLERVASGHQKHKAFGWVVLHGVKSAEKQKELLDKLIEFSKKKPSVYFDISKQKWVQSWRDLDLKCIEYGFS